MKILGLDYSINCGTACILADDKIHYILPEQHLSKVKFNCLGYKNETPFNTAVTLVEQIKALLPTCDMIAIEGASFGSQGRHSDIGEGLGRILFQLEDFYPDATILRPAPTSVKKFATGSGKAQKDMMIKKWAHETHSEIAWTKGTKKYASRINDASPFSDIADSYFMMRWAQNAYYQLKPTNPFYKPTVYTVPIGDMNIN